MLSVAKLQAAQELCRISKAVFILVVKCADAIYWVKITDYTQFPVVIAGRKDRKDSQDIEPCVMIPMQNFTSLVI